MNLGERQTFSLLQTLARHFPDEGRDVLRQLQQGCTVLYAQVSLAPGLTQELSKFGRDGRTFAPTPK